MNPSDKNSDLFTPLFISKNVWEIKEIDEPEFVKRIGGEMKKRVNRLLQAFRDEISIYRSVMTDSRCPCLGRWLLVAAAAYALSPIDLIPDFIPVLGHLDDILILSVIIWLAVRIIPRELIAEYRQRMIHSFPE